MIDKNLHEGQSENRPGASSMTRNNAHHPVILDEFTERSEPGNERVVMERVAAVVEAAHLPGIQIERLKTAVSEAALNAIEHGNEYQAEIPVEVVVSLVGDALTIRVTDQGGENAIPESTHPDLDAKLAGLQSPRGWGLFLIKNMVDEINIYKDAHHHTIELIFKLGSGQEAGGSKSDSPQAQI